MVDPYLVAIEVLLRRGQHANSYKFALLRALAHYARYNEPNRWIISREWLAERFVEYYWPLAVQYRVRQATDPVRNPVVMRLSLAVAREQSLPQEMPVKKVKRVAPLAYRSLVAEVSRQAFGDVIPRFHNLPTGQVEPVVYSFDENGIHVDLGAAQSLKENALVLEQLAMGAWVRFSEKFTSAPRLYEKIAGAAPTRRGLKAYEQFLRTFQQNKCFYCSTTLSRGAHVDHAIPWSFLLEDQVWNLVLSCDRCNLEKSARLPARQFVDRLVARNIELLSLDLSDIQLRIQRDLREWRVSNLEKHFRLLVDRCAADGFLEWLPAR